MGMTLAGLATPRLLPQAAKPEVPVGVVLEIVGPAYLRPAAGGAPLRLDPRRDILRKLYPGQNLRAGPGGRLKLELSTGELEIRSSETWVVLPDSNLTKEQTEVANALRGYGDAGGTRGMGWSSVFSPSEGGAVRAARMVIRWTPSAQRGNLDFSLEAEGGQKLWSQKGVDAATGKLDSETARQALADYQAGGGQEVLVLIMTDAEANETRTTFSLFSKSSEQELEKELAAWNQITDPLLRAVGRAYEFSRRRLVVEAAEEYEGALALAPESQALIAEAMEAHRRTGNHARAAELRKRLSTVSE